LLPIKDIITSQETNQYSKIPTTKSKGKIKKKEEKFTLLKHGWKLPREKRVGVQCFVTSLPSNQRKLLPHALYTALDAVNSQSLWVWCGMVPRTCLRVECFGTSGCFKIKKDKTYSEDSYKQRYLCSHGLVPPRINSL